MVSRPVPVLPYPGQPVMLRWARERAAGSVVEVCGDGAKVRVRVNVPVLGPDGELLGTESFTLPFESIVKPA
jgi:hypothetical protein